MINFFRFPHTPHLSWLGKGTPREDKVLSPNEGAEFLTNELIVEEKIDGANLGFSTNKDGELLAQNRGDWIKPETSHKQFQPLWSWLAPRREILIDALWPDLILFGEWCTTVHSVEYDNLPDWFLGFDVFDRAKGRFWSTQRRNELLAQLGLRCVPTLGRGHFDLEGLVALLDTSSVGSTLMEGIYLRAESNDWLNQRAKLVRAEFVQAIDSHWSRAPLRRNHLSPTAWS